MCKKIIGQANINAQELQDIDIILPPLSLQNRFAEFVKQADKSKFAALRQTKIAKLLYNNINGG
jgi:type I restriction enzyme S subunit